MERGFWATIGAGVGGSDLSALATSLSFGSLCRKAVNSSRACSFLPVRLVQRTIMFCRFFVIPAPVERLRQGQTGIFIGRSQFPGDLEPFCSFGQILRSPVQIAKPEVARARIIMIDHCA